MHKYRQQLLFYKLLVEHSASFNKKLIVNEGALEFIEADDEGRLVDNLDMSFDSEELQRFIKLVSAVWQHITQLSFPDVSQYAQNTRGVLQFEQDLIDGNI